MNVFPSHLHARIAYAVVMRIWTGKKAHRIPTRQLQLALDIYFITRQPLYRTVCFMEIGCLQSRHSLAESSSKTTTDYPSWLRLPIKDVFDVSFITEAFFAQTNMIE